MNREGHHRKFHMAKGEQECRPHAIDERPTRDKEMETENAAGRVRHLRDLSAKSEEHRVRHAQQSQVGQTTKTQNVLNALNVRTPKLTEIYDCHNFLIGCRVVRL